MKNKTFLITLITIIVLGTLATIIVTDSKWYFDNFVSVPDGKGEILIGELKSFDHPDKVANELDVKNYQWQVLSDSQFQGDDFRPQFNEYSIKVINYMNLGEAGSLELDFINRRLYKAVFYPINYENYLKKVKEKYNFKEKDIKTNDSILIQTGENFKGQYIQWVDVLLQNEVGEWIKRFS